MYVQENRKREGCVHLGDFIFFMEDGANIAIDFV